MKQFDRFYKELNAEQKQAVDILEGQILVLAGPGTGKTQLLSVRAANIIRQKNTLPENILILTYTNTAAGTMKERLSKIIGIKGYDVQAGTFHSFANSIILDSEEAANYIQERIQITDIEKVNVIEYIIDHAQGIGAIRPFRSPYMYVHDIQSRISGLKREGIKPDEFLEYAGRLMPDGIYIEEKHIHRIKALAIVYEEYEKLKKGRNKEVFDSRGRYDYDDMIMTAVDALDNEKDLKQRYQDQCGFIMVDEFQDTNGAQLKFLFSLLKGENPNLCCVGDDDQSIYRFQGAGAGNFKELNKRFENLKYISLKNNYRSSKEIIDLSRRLITEVPAEERTGDKCLIPVRDFKEKSIGSYEFTTEEEELCFIADKIEDFKKEIESSKELSTEEKQNPYNNIAVLVRKRALILKVIDKFLQRGIPYATDGKEDIRNELRVKQMLDVLELASLDPENYKDRDRILYYVLISDYFRIPHKDILSFMNEVNKKKKEKKQEVTFISEFFSKKGLPDSLKDAGKIIGKLLKEAPFKPVHTVLMEYVKEAGIFKCILDKYDKEDVMRIRQLRSLASFINMVKESDFSRPGMGLREFIEEIRTRNEHGLPIQGSLVTMTQNGVRVFTAHGAKGMEFHSVIIPFCLQDKSWPVKARPELIPLPPDLLKTEKADDKEKRKKLCYYDEARLFYVALSRAKGNVLFTSSPGEKAVSSSFLYHLGMETRTINRTEQKILLESLHVSDKKDPFIGTEAVLKDITDGLALNPTSLNNYLRCKRKFLYDNALMLPGAKKQSLIFGNAVHSALENVYRDYMQTNQFPDFQFFKERFLDSLKFQGPEKAMEIRCIENFQELKRYFDKISSVPVLPVGLENRMCVNIGGVVFTGKYDKLEVEDEKAGFVRVIDYKTGQAKKHGKGIYECGSLEDEECDDYLRQLVCYKLLYEHDKIKKHKHLTVSHGVLMFVEPAKEDVLARGIKKGEPTEFKVKLTKGMVDEMTGIIANVWTSIQALKFDKLPERSQKKCGWCDFDHICWEQA